MFLGFVLHSFGNFPIDGFGSKPFAGHCQELFHNISCRSFWFGRQIAVFSQDKICKALDNSGSIHISAVMV